MNSIELLNLFPSLIYFLIYSRYLLYWLNMLGGIKVFDVLLWVKAPMCRI